MQVAAALSFHFNKLNHNTTVYVRDEDYGMKSVIKSFQRGGWK